MTSSGAHTRGVTLGALADAARPPAPVGSSTSRSRCRALWWLADDGRTARTRSAACRASSRRCQRGAGQQGGPCARTVPSRGLDHARSPLLARLCCRRGGVRGAMGSSRRWSRATFGLSRTCAAMWYLDEQIGVPPGTTKIFNTEQKTQSSSPGPRRPRITAMAVSRTKVCRRRRACRRGREGARHHLRPAPQARRRGAVPADVQSRSCLPRLLARLEGLLGAGRRARLDVVYWLEEGEGRRCLKTSTQQNAASTSAVQPDRHHGRLRHGRWRVPAHHRPDARRCSARWGSASSPTSATRGCRRSASSSPPTQASPPPRGGHEDGVAAAPADGQTIDRSPYSCFVCGADGGTTYVFEEEDKDYYKRAKSFKVENTAVKIRHLAVSPAEGSWSARSPTRSRLQALLSNTDILCRRR